MTLTIVPFFTLSAVGLFSPVIITIIYTQIGLDPDLGQFVFIFIPTSIIMSVLVFDSILESRKSQNISRGVGK